MKLIISRPARADLEDVRIYLLEHYPRLQEPVKARMQMTLVQISQWPLVGHRVPERPGVRVFPLVKYPYKIYYQITQHSIEILHIHHSSRN